MLPQLDRSSMTPLYEQVYRFYTEAIRSHRIASGYRMPSVRKLAGELGVSNNTIVTCYQQLLDEGYVHTIERKGLFVNVLDRLSRERMPSENIPAFTPVRIKYNLGRSVVNESHFPMRAWRKAQQMALDSLSYQYMQYDFHAAASGLKEQLLPFLYSMRGVVGEKENTIVAAGCNSLFILLALIFKEEFNTILFEEPGFEHARTIFEQSGYVVETVKVNQDGIDLESLQKKKKSLLFLTPSHQYPTGAVMPAANRIKVLNWAKRTASFIIEDDYDSVFRHKHKPMPALQGLDGGDRVIYIGTFSKIFIPSLRIAYMILPKQLLPNLEPFQYLAYSVPYQTQRALALFMETGELDRHIRRMRKYYREKYFLTLAALKDVFGKKITIIESAAGLSILIAVRTRKSESRLIELARLKSIALRGEAVTYYHKANIPAQPRIFIGFGNVLARDITLVLTLLKKVWFDTTA